MVVRGDVMINANSVHLYNIHVGLSILSNAISSSFIEWILVGVEISSVEDLIPYDIQSDDMILDGKHVCNREKSCPSLLI